MTQEDHTFIPLRRAFTRDAQAMKVIQGMTFIRLVAYDFASALGSIKDARDARASSLITTPAKCKTALLRYWQTPTELPAAQHHESLINDLTELAHIYAEAKSATELLMTFQTRFEPLQPFMPHAGLRLIYDTMPEAKSWAFFRIDGQQAKLSASALVVDIVVHAHEGAAPTDTAARDVEFLARLADYNRELTEREYPGASEISPQLFAKLMDIQFIMFDQDTKEAQAQAEADEEEGQKFESREEVEKSEEAEESEEEELEESEEGEEPEEAEELESDEEEGKESEEEESEESEEIEGSEEPEEAEAGEEPQEVEEESEEPEEGKEIEELEEKEESEEADEEESEESEESEETEEGEESDEPEEEAEEGEEVEELGENEEQEETEKEESEESEESKEPKEPEEAEDAEEEELEEKAEESEETEDPEEGEELEEKEELEETEEEEAEGGESQESEGEKPEGKEAEEPEESESEEPEESKESEGDESEGPEESEKSEEAEDAKSEEQEGEVSEKPEEGKESEGDESEEPEKPEETDSTESEPAEKSEQPEEQEESEQAQETEVPELKEEPEDKESARKESESSKSESPEPTRDESNNEPKPETEKGKHDSDKKFEDAATDVDHWAHHGNAYQAKNLHAQFHANALGEVGDVAVKSGSFAVPSAFDGTVSANDVANARTFAMPPINDRLYSIVTATIPVSAASDVSVAYNAPPFQSAYSLAVDPAHDIASSLLTDIDFKTLDPTHGINVRQPNMDHSFGSMFAGMPLPTLQPKVV